MKRIICILAIILAFSCVLCSFVGCNNDKKEEEPVYTDYTVKIVDILNEPVSNVVVKFKYPDGSVKTRVTESDGTATIKNVLAAEYTVYIDTEFSKLIMADSVYTLTKDNNYLNLVVHHESRAVEIYGEFNERTYSYTINAGEHEVSCEDGRMTYFIFNALQTGTYRVSVSSDKDMTVGYYGIPLFVQSTHRGESEYDGKSFDLIIQDSATPYVFGVSCAEDAVGRLVIERTGDAPFDPQYAPWTIFESELELTKCDLPDGSTLTDLDVTDKTLSVTLGDDGYYYTDDGKLVYVRIGSVSTAKYLEVSIAHIAGLIDNNVGQNFGGYVYDENGVFVAKYSFNNMLGSYYEMCGDKGVYPLTEELANAIQIHGNSHGWWREGTINYLFTGVDVNLDNAWLFLCCTVD